MSSRTKVKYTKYFYGKIKKLSRKFPSLAFDLEELQKTLKAMPRTGTPLGNNTYKIRLAIRSKSKGKRGGARVISFVETELIAKVESTTLTLLTIYDKSEIDSVSAEKILDLIKNIESD